jgi:hypothetical protein
VPLPCLFGGLMTHLRLALLMIAAAVPAAAQEPLLKLPTPAISRSAFSDQNPLPSDQADALLQFNGRPVMGDAIARKLGVAQGRFEVFDRTLDGGLAPDADLHASIDGNGVKLKLSW